MNNRLKIAEMNNQLKLAEAASRASVKEADSKMKIALKAEEEETKRRASHNAALVKIAEYEAKKEASRVLHAEKALLIEEKKLLAEEKALQREKRAYEKELARESKAREERAKGELELRLSTQKQELDLQPSQPSYDALRSSPKRPIVSTAQKFGRSIRRLRNFARHFSRSAERRQATFARKSQLPASASTLESPISRDCAWNASEALRSRWKSARLLLRCFQLLQNAANRQSAASPEPRTPGCDRAPQPRGSGAAHARPLGTDARSE
eukprot:scaffold4983_cov292-Pinguiococcus_pyrenoidosus.AAC.1